MAGEQSDGGRLTARNLGCRRGGRWVFHSLDATIGPGELLLLAGPNGSGKSSLLRLLAGFLRPAAGELAWDGTAIAADPAAHRARLAYLGHLDAVKPALSAEENLLFWARLNGLGAAAARAVVASALAALALASLADLPARFFSAGQRRRLALGRLLVAPRPLWLLDEPTVGLDKEAVERLATALGEHRATGGSAVIATHIELPLAATARLDLSAFRVEAAAAEELSW